MVADRADLVHLRRIDPGRGMGRFYSLTLQPTLLGGVDLVRRWGRLGTSGGSTLTETYPDEASAQAALEKLAPKAPARLRLISNPGQLSAALRLTARSASSGATGRSRSTITTKGLGIRRRGKPRCVRPARERPRPSGRGGVSLAA